MILKKLDYDILSFLEYPKNLDEIRNMFSEFNVTAKILELKEKGLIEEKSGKYFSKFHTPPIKKMIEDSGIPEPFKKKFNFFLSQIDNPFVRQNIFNTEAREKTNLVLSLITKSLSQDLTEKDLAELKIAIGDLMDKL